MASNDLTISGINITELVSSSLHSVLPEVEVRIDGTLYRCRGIINLETGDTGTATLIHNTGTLKGNIRPLEGATIHWRKRTYYIERVGGTEYVAWVCECGPSREDVPVATSSLRIYVDGVSIIITRENAIQGTIYYRYKRSDVQTFGSEIIATSRVAIIAPLEASTSYDVEGYVITDSGKRLESVTATVTTGS